MSTMSAISRALLFAAAALAAPALAAPSADAHELPQATARVTLRDDHVDVAAELDVIAFVATASGAGSAEALGAADDAALAALVARARDTLGREARLEADGARVDLEVRAFPSVAEVRALASWASSSPRAHGELRPVRLEASERVAGAERITLSLPRAAGPVLISFVQPAAQWTTPGAAATFPVLAPRAPAPDLAVPARTYAAFAAAALAIAALLLLPARSRRARAQTPVESS